MGWCSFAPSEAGASTRFSPHVLVVCALLTLVGCSGEPNQAPPAPQGSGSETAPLTSVAAIGTSRSAMVSPELHAELEDLGLAAIGDELAPAKAGKAYQGPAPKALAESAQPIETTTPERLLGGMLAALERGDVAALARLRRPASRYPTLTEDDGADAERRFLSSAMAPTWERVSSAFGQGAYEVVETSPREAVLVVKVGGALGAYRIPLRKDGDSWFMS